MKVLVRKDLEGHNPLIFCLRFLTVPLMNSIPKSTLQKMMHKTSRDASTVVSNSGSTMALEAMYTRYHRGLFSRGIRQGLADIFWHHLISQPKALRNRLKIVEETIESRLISLIKKGQKDIKILNIGGGSSRALIHSLHKLFDEGFDFNPSIVNIDKDKRAIEIGKKIAKDHGLEKVFKWINSDVRNLDSLVAPDSIDIVEMVGLLDYFDDNRANAVMKVIHKSLKKGGLFIVANIHFNNEMKFIRNTGWPEMYYRGASDMERIVKDAGFEREPNLIFEPLKVHIITVVEK